MRSAILDQLDVPWQLAIQYSFPMLDEAAAHWKPSTNACDVQLRDGAWIAQLPDEDRTPIPDVTPAWLLWHMEWWWTNALRGVGGETALAPDEHRWAGSVADSVQRLHGLHDEWLEVVAATALDHACEAPFPTPLSFGSLALWVNVELMKNVAELGQLVRWRANQGFATAV